MRVSSRLLPIAIAAISAALAAAQTPEPAAIEGKVIGVHDGDTLTLLIDEDHVPRVRLAGIDAPELKQPFGSRAKQALSRLCFGRRVLVETSGKDKYGRLLGVVFVEEAGEQIDVNRRLVADGMAWHYARYSDSRELAEAESQGRRRRLGLWADAEPTPPWEWRKTETERRAAAKATAAVARKSASSKPEKTPDVGRRLDVAAGKYWLNTASGVRHRAGCRYFGKTKDGRACAAQEGRACKICGG